MIGTSGFQGVMGQKYKGTHLNLGGYCERITRRGRVRTGLRSLGRKINRVDVL